MYYFFRFYLIKLDIARVKTIIQAAQKYYANNSITSKTTLALPANNSTLGLTSNKLSGNVYIKKDGRVAFQGLNNGKCYVKRYDQTNPEVFINNNSICSKNIYSNLVINGYGEYGDNTNFSSFTYNASTNDFKIDVAKVVQQSNDYYISVDINKKYNYSLDTYTDLSNEVSYLGLVEYDIDHLLVPAFYVMYVPNTLTTLDRDLKNGDTVIYLSDLSNWEVSTTNPYYQRGFIFWNYKDSTGYQYPPLTYSRNRNDSLFESAMVNKTNNTIILNSGWSYGTFSKGTQVSQSSDGAYWGYSLAAGQPLGNSYKTYSTIIEGISYNNSNWTSFRYPTKYVKLFLGLNYNGISSSVKPPYTYIKNIVFEEID